MFVSGNGKEHPPANNILVSDHERTENVKRPHDGRYFSRQKKSKRQKKIQVIVDHHDNEQSSKASNNQKSQFSRKQLLDQYQNYYEFYLKKYGIPPPTVDMERWGSQNYKWLPESLNKEDLNFLFGEERGNKIMEIIQAKKHLSTELQPDDQTILSKKNKETKILRTKLNQTLVVPTVDNVDFSLLMFLTVHLHRLTKSNETSRLRLVNEVVLTDEAIFEKVRNMTKNSNLFVADIYWKLPFQCLTCGLRFSTSESKSIHLDTHVKLDTISTSGGANGVAKNSWSTLPSWIPEFSNLIEVQGNTFIITNSNLYDVFPSSLKMELSNLLQAASEQTETQYNQGNDINSCSDIGTNEVKQLGSETKLTFNNEKLHLPTGIIAGNDYQILARKIFKNRKTSAKIWEWALSKEQPLLITSENESKTKWFDSLLGDPPMLTELANNSKSIGDNAHYYSSIPPQVHVTNTVKTLEKNTAPKILPEYYTFVRDLNNAISTETNKTDSTTVSNEEKNCILPQAFPSFCFFCHDDISSQWVENNASYLPGHDCIIFTLDMECNQPDKRIEETTVSIYNGKEENNQVVEELSKNETEMLLEGTYDQNYKKNKSELFLRLINLMVPVPLLVRTQEINYKNNTGSSQSLYAVPPQSASELLTKQGQTPYTEVINSNSVLMKRQNDVQTLNIPNTNFTISPNYYLDSDDTPQNEIRLLAAHRSCWALNVEKISGSVSHTYKQLSAVAPPASHSIFPSRATITSMQHHTGKKLRSTLRF